MSVAVRKWTGVGVKYVEDAVANGTLDVSHKGLGVISDLAEIQEINIVSEKSAMRILVCLISEIAICK